MVWVILPDTKIHFSTYLRGVVSVCGAPVLFPAAALYHMLTTCAPLSSMRNIVLSTYEPGTASTFPARDDAWTASRRSPPFSGSVSSLDTTQAIADLFNRVFS